jgi:hypothetical protein
MADSALAKGRIDYRARPQRLVRRTPDDRDASAAHGYSTPGTSRFAHYTTQPISFAAPAVFGIILAAVLLARWLNRDEHYLAPDSGAGYWLGVAGATLMLLLLLYPLRKRIRFGRSIGSVALWFRLHMIPGLVGPALNSLPFQFQIGLAQ